MSNLISQSEADAFLTCRRRHYYAHIEKIKPKKFSEALNRGTLGHLILEAYYKHLKENPGAFDSAQKAAEATMAELYSDENLQTLGELANLFKYFFPWAQATQKDWEILEVETEYRYPVPGTDLVFPFKVDLIYRDRRSGRNYMVDHKFIRDFYFPELIVILPQMAKYIGALRRLGVQIHDGQYQMIRTRAFKTEQPIENRLKIQNMNLKDSKIDHYMREQFSTMMQIQQAKSLPQKVWRDRYALRSANQFNCKNCPFLDLCSLDLLNGNRELHIKAFYEPNDYGYEEFTDEPANA